MWHNEKHHKVFSSPNVNVIKIEDGKTCSIHVEPQNQFSVLVRIHERKTPIQRHEQ
jgi:hypothetical protein